MQRFSSWLHGFVAWEVAAARPGVCCSPCLVALPELRPCSCSDDLVRFSWAAGGRWDCRRGCASCEQLGSAIAVRQLNPACVAAPPRRFAHLPELWLRVHGPKECIVRMQVGGLQSPWSAGSFFTEREFRPWARLWARPALPALAPARSNNSFGLRACRAPKPRWMSAAERARAHALAHAKCSARRTAWSAWSTNACFPPVVPNPARLCLSTFSHLLSVHSPPHAAGEERRGVLGVPELDLALDDEPGAGAGAPLADMLRGGGGFFYCAGGRTPTPNVPFCAAFPGLRHALQCNVSNCPPVPHPSLPPPSAVRVGPGARLLLRLVDQGPGPSSSRRRPRGLLCRVHCYGG